MIDEEQIFKYMTTKKYDKDKYNCWHFVQEAYKEHYGIELPDYPVTEVPAEFKHRMEINFNHERIAEGKAKSGDIIIFSMFNEQHAGIMLNDEYFIHMGKTNVQVTELQSVGKNYVIYRILGKN